MCSHIAIILKILITPSSGTLYQSEEQRSAQACTCAHAHAHTLILCICRSWLTINLMLEHEVQRERKLGVKWGKQGQSGTTSTDRDKSPQGQTETNACSYHYCPVWYGVSICFLVVGPNTYLVQESEQLKEDAGEGQAFQACLLITLRDETPDQWQCVWATKRLLLQFCSPNLPLVSLLSMVMRDRKGSYLTRYKTTTHLYFF